MATSFAQQPQALASPMLQHTSQYPYFSNHRSNHSTGHFTPPSSTTPPSTNSSPTNVMRQAYQAKQCGYIPAALRPTEMPTPKQKRPMTPPRSAHSSVDSQVSRGSFLLSKSMPATPVDDMSSFMAPYGAVTRVVTDEWNDDFGNVTGMPTRNHWKVCSDSFFLFLHVELSLSRAMLSCGGCEIIHVPSDKMHICPRYSEKSHEAQCKREMLPVMNIFPCTSFQAFLLIMVFREHAIHA